MSDAQENFFLSSFLEVANHVGAPPDKILLAKEALSELFKVYEPTARFAGHTIPFYANHDETHGARLGRVGADILKTQIKGGGNGLAICNIQALTLAYAAFLFHDIGMAELPEGAKPYESVKDQKARFDHDERSLRIVERDLIEKFANLKNWSNFWEKTSQPKMAPLPHGKYELYILARICKSHGDRLSIWLQDGSLDTYTERTGEKSNHNFVVHWGKRGWEQFSEKVYAASTLLCIADLCDLGPKRFVKPPKEWLEHTLPDQDFRRWSFLHYMSHQVSTITFDKDAIVVSIDHSDQIDWAYESALYCGAASDLIFWGNQSVLVERVIKHINPNYKKARIERASVNSELWEELLVTAKSSDFVGCWPFLEFNSAISSDGKCSKEIFFEMLVCIGIARQLLSDLEEHDGQEEKDLYRVVLLMLSEGVLLSETLLPIEANHENSIFSIYTGNSNSTQRETGEAKTSRFVGAIKLAQSLAKNHLNAYKVRLVSFSSKVFKELATEHDLSTLENTIYICEVRDWRPSDADDYQKIVGRSIDFQSRNIKVIFTSNKISSSYEKITLIEKVACEFNEVAIHRFIENSTNRVSLTDFENIVLSSKSDKPVEPTVKTTGSLIQKLWLRGANVEKLLSIIGEASPSAPEAYFNSMSILAFLTFIECAGKRQTKSSSSYLAEKVVVKQIYSSFINAQQKKPFMKWETVCSHFPSDMTKESEKHFKIDIQLIETAYAVGRKKASKEGRWFQLFAASFFLHTNLKFNPASNSILRSNITLDHARAMIKEIDNPENSNEAKVVLATTFGHFLGNQAARNNDGFSWAMACFPSSTVFRATLKSCLHFQVSYRVARACIENNGFYTQVGPSKNQAVSLGLLEAICRDADSKAKISKANLRAMVMIMNDLGINSSTEGKLSEMVFFDIFWKYCKNLKVKDRKLLRFIESRKEMGWDTIAEQFHSAAGLNRDFSPIKDKQGAKLTSWSKFREHFHFVLGASPDSVRRGI